MWSPRLPILKNSPLLKKNPPSSFIDFITKVSDIIAEPNDDFSHGHFEIENFILAQKLTFITPSTFSDFAFFAPPPCLFRPPHLLER